MRYLIEIKTPALHKDLHTDILMSEDVIYASRKRDAKFTNRHLVQQLIKNQSKIKN